MKNHDTGQADRFRTLPVIDGRPADFEGIFTRDRLLECVDHDSMRVYYDVSIAKDGGFTLTEKPTTAARAELLVPVFRRLLDELGPEASVIDLACSPGYFMFKLAQMGFKNLTGVDARPDHRDQFELQNRYFGFDGMKFVLSDMYEFLDDEMSRGGKYDVCLLFGFLYHTAVPVELLRNIRKICRYCLVVDTTLSYKEDSSLIVRVENTSWSRASTTRINMMPSLSSIPKLLEAAGYDRSERFIPDPRLKAYNPGGGNIDYYFDQGYIGKAPVMLRRAYHKFRELSSSNGKVPDRRAFFLAYP